MLLLEGAVCVAIALPAFLGFSSLGGFAAYMIGSWRGQSLGVLSAALVAPLIASGVEQTLPVPSHVATVESSVHIDAAPEAVWREIVDVRLIDPAELSFGLTRLMGMPRPLEAHMQRSERGWVRNTCWDKGVEFREEITQSRELEYLNWRFDFPPSAVPEGVLDEHVLVGGRYFELLDGGYTLERMQDGSTILTLSTSYRVSARPSLYARLCAFVVMADFHRMILRLMRDRSEAAAP